MLNKIFILKIWAYQKLYLNLQKNLKEYEYTDKNIKVDSLVVYRRYRFW